MTTSDAIASPCVSNCCLNEEDVCLGCYRSLDEILAWRAANNEQRQGFLDLAIQRKEAHRRKYPLNGGS